MVRRNVARNPAATCLPLGYPEWSANAVAEGRHASPDGIHYANEETKSLLC